jgi:hypothetical protein
MKEKFLSMLDTHHTVYVYLDPRKGATLPQYLMDRDVVCLEWGLDMPIPITRLTCTDIYLAGDLSFSSGSFYCLFPWKSVLDIRPGIEKTKRELASFHPPKPKKAIVPKGWGVVKGGKA